MGCLKELWVEFTQDVAHIPVSEHTARLPAEVGQFDITSSPFFLTQPLWQRRPMRNKVSRHAALFTKNEGSFKPKSPLGSPWKVRLGPHLKFSHPPLREDL